MFANAYISGVINSIEYRKKLTRKRSQYGGLDFNIKVGAVVVIEFEGSK